MAVLRAVLADHRLGRRVLAGLAVAVATAFAAASVQLTGAAAAAIVRELAATPLDADLVVTPGGADVEQRVRATPGVDAVAAAGAAPVARVVAGGAAEPWTALRSDGGPLARYPLVAGRLPAGPDEAAVSERAAGRVAVGEQLELVDAAGAPRRLAVTGVVAARGEPLDAVVVTPDVAVALTGAEPEQLDVRVAPGAAPAAVAAALTGTGAAVRDAGEVRTGELEQLLGDGLAGVLAALALFGGTAVVAAVLTTSCVLGVLAGRQRRTIGLLRRAGAGRGQVLRALLADAALTGLGAGVGGAALSVGLVELVRVGVRLALGEDLPSPGVPWLLLGASAAGAVLAVVLAAVGPAVRLSGATPVAPVVTRGRPVPRLLLALAAAGAAVGLLQLREPDPVIALAFVAAAGLLAYAAAVAAGPWLFPSVAAVLGLPLALLATGRLAIRSARRSPRRATTTVAVLTLLGMLLTTVLVGLQSMTLSAQDRIAARFPAPVSVVARADAALSDDLAARLVALPEAAAAVAVRETTMADGTRVALVDPAAFPALLDGAVDAGSLAGLRPGTVALDRAEAAARGLRVGDGLDLGDGLPRPVVAVHRSSGVLGSLTLHPDDGALVPPAPVRQVLLAPAGDADALRAAATTAVGPDPAAAVLELGGLRNQLDAAVALVRAIALGLVGATALVGVVGVAVAMALAQRERHRESVVLRALGMTPGQVVAAAGVESMLLAAAGAVAGVGLGGVFGVLAVFALGEAAVIPVDEVLVGAGALLAVAVLAGLVPAVRSARGGSVPGPVR